MDTDYPDLTEVIARTQADAWQRLLAAGVPEAARAPTVYLIHFDRPYGHARHYLGWTSLDVRERLAQHRAGRGARLLQVVAEAGIEFDVVRIWSDTDRSLERRLKDTHHRARLCPVCNPETWYRFGSR